ncbi:hypothetical protein EJB05_35353, partial [Eragrostis curvula]
MSVDQSDSEEERTALQRVATRVREPRVCPDLPFSAGDAKPNRERANVLSKLVAAASFPSAARPRSPSFPGAARPHLLPGAPCSTASFPGAPVIHYLHPRRRFRRAPPAPYRAPTAPSPEPVRHAPRPPSPEFASGAPPSHLPRPPSHLPRSTNSTQHFAVSSSAATSSTLEKEKLFDLNFEPVDVDGDDADAALNSLLHTPQGVGQQPEVAGSDEGHTSSEDDNAESAGMTVPTATTASGAVDVEEGVEVISTPNDPCVGMTFDTCEAAKSFYNNYARYKGFSVRIDNSNKTKWAGGKSRVKYVCHKAGVNKKNKPATDGPITEKKVTKKRKRDHIERTKCPALMAVKFTGSYWVVDTFRAEHNHDLVQKFSLTKFLRSHRDIPPEEKQFIRTLHSCTIKTVRAYQLMCELYGGEQNVPYTVCDCKNLRKSYGAENEGKDMKKTFELFDEMKKQDPDFFYDYTLHIFGRVEHLFWIDGESVRQFAHYGDCISFDTTYCTNKYNMPCAPFIGINRHGQSIQLGCGFLRNEKTESFVWLFERFKIACGVPAYIITDQAAAIAAAIEKVFPEAVHRLCRWHIMENVRKHMGAFLSGNKQLADDFNDCISNSFSPEEFQSKWQAMIDTHEQHGHEGFEALHRIRQDWIPAYFMDCFFPFLQTTARSEGFNAVLKRYVNPNNSLLTFVEQYMKIQQSILGRKNEFEFNTLVREPDFLTGHPMEQQMMVTYTRRLFNVFQVELQYTSSYFIRETGTPNVFDIVPYTACPEPLYHSRTFRVRANPSDEEYECTCCKFARDGILCCHILKVFDKLAVRLVPARYIKQRWTMIHDEDGAEPQLEAMLEAPGMTDSGKQAVRHHRVCNSFAKITRPSVAIDDEYAVIVRHVEALQSELLQMRKNKVSSTASEAHQGGTAEVRKTRGKKTCKTQQPKKPQRKPQKTQSRSQVQVNDTSQVAENQQETGQTVDDIIGMRFDRSFARGLEEQILNYQCCGREDTHVECNDSTGENYLQTQDTTPNVEAPTLYPKDPPCLPINIPPIHIVLWAR